jgi:hypothetical protein
VADGAAKWVDVILIPSDNDAGALTKIGAYASYLADARFVKRIRFVPVRTRKSCTGQSCTSSERHVILSVPKHRAAPGKVAGFGFLSAIALPPDTARFTLPGAVSLRGVAVSTVILVLVAGSIVTSSGFAHRSGCHSKHACPSDHATYRWRGLLCVSPTADERTNAFKRRVVYASRVYYCRK